MNFIRLRHNTLQLSAGMKGKVNRTTCLDGVLTKSEAHQSEGGLLLIYHFNVGMATAQFRFDTPTACRSEAKIPPGGPAGSFILTAPGIFLPCLLLDRDQDHAELFLQLTDF